MRCLKSSYGCISGKSLVTGKPLIAVIVMYLIFLLLPANSFAAGSITGRVTNSSGAGISDVSVYLLESGGSYEYATTQPDGTYAVVLPAGSYKVIFYSPGTGYITQWYNNKTSSTLADTVPVTAGASASVINATLVMGGTISGRITNSSGAGIGGVTVYAFAAAGDYSYNYGRSDYSSYTESNGNYTIVGLPTGNYILKFQGNDTGYVNQWFNGKASSALAETIAVTAGATNAGVDAVITTGGIISGRVTNEGGIGLPSIHVDVFESSGNVVTSVFTNDQGYYQAVGLPDGMVKVHFSSQNNGLYSGQWYSNKGQFNSADSVSVTSLEIDAVLESGADIFPYPAAGNFENNAVRTFYIINSGSADLTLGTTGLSGTNAADFSFQDDLCSGKTIPPSSSCMFKTKFNPSTVGVKSATISIPSNDPDTAVLNILLSGSGTPAVLNTIFLGNGTGSIHSSPDTGISCIKGISDGCSNTFAVGTLVTLTASPEESSSIFGGWSNACNSVPCEITVDADKTAEATFTLAPKIKLDVGATSGYNSFPVAYSNASSTLFSLGGLFPGDWLLDKVKHITLKGGYYADYGPTRNGFTILNGKLTIKSGSLRADSVKVRR